MERMRLRNAMRRPWLCQNVSSSGRQLVSQRRAAPAPTRCSLTIRSRSAGSRSSTAARSPFSASQVHTITPATTAYISMKVLERTPDRIGGDAEHDGKGEAAKPADDADQPADGAHVAGVIVGKFAVDAGFANAHRHADNKDENREKNDVDGDVQGRVAFDAVHHQSGGRIGEQEQADDADPEHPPGRGAAAELVRDIPAERAYDAGRQSEEHGDEGGGAKT